uniref:PGG domain-containing protein n=1 Tax=Fagus sylvatica TaxID=28930 RepID=A0A2N9EJ48_FAGSY
MDPSLYNAARKSDINTFKQRREHLDLRLLLTPNKNTVLHINITAQYGSSKSAEFVQKKSCVMCPPLLLQVNIRDETLLHIAARYGDLSVVNLLIQTAKADGNKDLESGTESVRQMMRMLNKEKDTALHEAVRNNHLDVVKLLIKEDPGFSYHANHAGETPLYLAAERGYRDLVFEILRNCNSPAHSGPLGLTALHAAVIRKDEEFDESAAYLADKKEYKTALHIAAGLGHTGVMKELLSRCSDCCEMVDIRERNALHFAKDAQANTPLHLLASSLSFIPSLIRHPKVDPMVFNNQNRSALDIALANDMVSEVKESIVKCLVEIGSRPDDSHDSCNNNNNSSNPENKVMKDKENEDDIIRDFKQGKDPHLLVATLIATVAFAAGFTMPGGYISEKGDDDRGQAILTSSKAFQAFVITDTIALMLSGFAVLAHIFAPVIHKKKVIHRLFMTQFYFTSFALLAMVLAFLTGIYAVLRQSSALAISTCVIVSVFSALLYGQPYLNIFR